MERARFDALAISLTEEGASRRSVLGRLVAGGVAAALGITAFAAFGDDDAEAKKRRKCRRRCKKKNTSRKRRKCRKRCKKKNQTNTCAVNSDCKGGEICINAQCTSTCTGNAQCSGSKVCINGACVTGCQTEAQCGGGQTCVNGGCATLCTTTLDCTGDQVCIEGVCGTPNTPPTGALLCTVQADCGADQLCIAGVCVVGCTTDGDCTGGLVCGDLLGNPGLRVCLAPTATCPGTPCTGLLSACILGICVAVGEAP